MQTDTAPRDVLTQEEAERRAARISDCAYTLSLDLVPGSGTYRGDVTLTFDDGGSGDTFLCFRGKTIERYEINGMAVEPSWNGFRLAVPGGALQPHNAVHIVYVNEYDHGGDGFHQFFDPEDGQEYLYSNFEPYEAHRLFPCFDQPDIKATYSLTVTAPASWEVIHNAPTASVAPAPDGRRTWQFQETRRFSTYLFCIVAGPYHVFRDSHRDSHGEIPLGIYTRKSMARYTDHEEIFTLTKQGLAFFADFFGFAYPFGKYDQLFVPEFNAGAMENVACVTFNEAEIHRDPPTESQRHRRAEVILHEMAHMWFGDLVTMKWWNDLWLNESFAEYMAFVAMTRATRFTNAWQQFNGQIKNWAYRQDQLITTHPIAAQVDDTEQTFLNFDGITYGKGASVLKQLVATIGYDAFRDGMRHYFAQHAYGNTTLAQFLEALERGSGRQLKEWAKSWLETPSLNTVAARVEADGERISSLTLTQAASPDYPTLRPHTLEVGLVREAGSTLEVSAIPASIDSAEASVPGAVGLPAPSLVFPNYNDHGYLKAALDADSVTFARENLHRIDDALLRQMLWSSFWTMTRDQQLKSTAFLALIASQAVREPDIQMVETVLNYAQTALTRFVPEEWKERESRTLVEAYWAALQAAPPGDAQITWTRALINAATHPDDLALLARLADGDERVDGLTVDQQMRWNIAVKHMAYAVAGAAARVAAEAARDPSDRGKREQLRAQTSAPDAATKRDAWAKFNGDGYGSLHLTAAAMSGFNWPRQRDLLAPYVEKFFTTIPDVVRTRDREFYADYFGALFPAYRVEVATLERSERLLGEVADTVPNLARLLREANDELSRALRCREFASS
jgi:aminopeptidase N